MSTTNGHAGHALYLKVTIKTETSKWASDSSHTLDARVTYREPGTLKEYYPIGSGEKPEDVMRTLVYHAIDWSKHLAGGDHAFNFGMLMFTDQYCVDRETVDIMADIFRRVDKGLAKITADQGPAENAAQHIFRLAKVLKADGMIFDNGRYQTDMTGQKESMFGLVGGLSRVRHMIWSLQQDAREPAANAEPVAVAATA